MSAPSHKESEVIGVGDTVEALKALAVAMGCASKVSDITTKTIPETINFIAKNYPGRSGA